ncbi:MAG TPA: pyrroline-5-carboxylate reductase, partial [Clostridiales bacterium]|nr:pyrroline-5-carboxylate reductase [Clostridiales bacterium]
TNLASLHVLEKEGFRSGVIQAMIACSERADEMEK